MEAQRNLAPLCSRSAYICLPRLSPASFREHRPALRQPPRCPTHDRAGERQDGPGPEPGREQGPLSHERVRGGNRPQRGRRQGRTHGGGGRAAGGERCTDCGSELTGHVAPSFLFSVTFFYIIYLFTPSDQWASPLWPQSPECIVHNQELFVKSQNRLHQV